MDDKEPFLSRWSRRKLETKADQRASDAKAAELPPAAAPPVAAATQPAAELQEHGTPEFREFFDPRVDEALRRVALKKLFGDPHFNVMDGLDTYIDDYSKPDPIPAAMLRQLNQAKELFLFDDEKKADKKPDAGAGDEPGVAREPDPASPAESADTSTPADAPTAGASGAEVATFAPAAAPLDTAGNK